MTTTVAPYDMERAIPQPSTAVASAPVPQISDAGVNARLAAAQQDKELAAATDEYGLHLDTLQAQDALNTLRAKKEDLSYGQNGFMQVKGGEVINPNRPGGPLLDDYKARFQAVTDDTAKNLSPRARLMFNEKAAAEMTAFKGEIGRHSLQQTEVYQKSVFNSGNAQDTSDAVRYAQDPTMVAQIGERARARAENFARTEGLDPGFFAASAQSNVIRGAIESRASQNDGPGAVALFKAFGSKLDAKDTIEVGRTIKTVETGQQARDYFTSLTGAAVAGSPGVTPTAVHRAIVGQESGGQQYDAKGNVLTSVNGAQGVGQMIPDTFKKYALPGEKIENKEDNLAASRRAIDDYYKKYNGDVGRIATAYFSGEGNVAEPGSPTPYKTDAKDGNGKSTSSYVADIGKRLGVPTPGPAPASAPAGGAAPASSTTTTGDSAPPAPAPAAPKTEGPPGFLDTRQMTIDAERWHIAASAQNQRDHADNPALLANVKNLIDVQYESRKAQVELAKNQLNKAVEDWVSKPDANGAAQTQRPPPEVWNQLSYEKQRSIDATLAHNAKGADNITDMGTFYQLERMAGAQPSDFSNVDLMLYRNKLSKADFEKLSGLQRTALSGDPTVGDLRDKHAIVNDAAAGVGLKMSGTRTDAEATQANNFLSWVEEAGKSWALQNGRKPNGQEWQKIVDGVTMKIPHSGMFSDNRLYELSASDVPSALKADALTTFAKRGAPEPSDHDLIAMHAASKVGVVPQPWIPLLASELKKRGRAVTPQNLLGAYRLIQSERAKELPSPM